MASKYKVQPGNGVEQDRVESGIYAKLNDDNQEQRAPSPEGYRGSLEFTAAQDRMRLMQNAQSNPGEMVTLTDAERDIISGTVVYNKQVGGGGGRDLPSMRDLKIMMDNKDLDPVTRNWLKVNWERRQTNKGHLFSEELLETYKAWKTRDVKEKLETKELAVWGGFNSFDHTPEKLSAVITDMFEASGVLDDFKVDRGKWATFVSGIKDLYHMENPYHNYYHGVDVAVTGFALSVSQTGFANHLSGIHAFSYYIACFCHDVDHPGVTNAFHKNAQTPLAKLYNDNSILENHHAATTFSVAAREESNIFSNCTPEGFDSIRSVVVAMILATDMAVHFELVENFKKLCATRGEEIGNLQPNENEIVVEPNEEMLLMKVMLHCADISNAAKPWKVSKEWSKRVWEEFTLQAEQEKRLGLPVTALVKDDPEQGVAEMSLNFIDYIVAPLFDVLQVVLPDLDGPFNFVESNRKSWKAKVQNIYKEEQERRKSPSGQMHRMSAHSQNTLATIRRKIDLIESRDQEFKHMKSTRLVRQQSRAPRGPSLNANSARIVSASLADTSHQLPTSDTKGPPFGSATIASLPGRQTIATEDSSAAVPMTEEERREAEMRKIKESMRKERERIEREGVQGQEELEEKRKRRSISMSKNNRLKVVVADKTNYLQSKESMIIKLQEETVINGLYSKYLDDKWSNAILGFFDHIAWNVSISLITVYALFGDDFKFALSDQSADVAFSIVTVVVMVIFTFEMVFMWVADPTYRMGFFFTLDMVSTISLLFDIHWFVLYINGYTDVETCDSTSEAGASVTDSTVLARGGRVAKVGARAGRVVRFVRIIRVVRLVRVFKLFKLIVRESEKEQEDLFAKKRRAAENKRKRKSKESRRGMRDSVIGVDLPDPAELPQSKIGQKLTEVTTTKVIVMTLAILLTMQLINMFEIPNDLWTYSVGLLHASAMRNETSWALLADSYAKGTPELFALSFNGTQYYLDQATESSLRCSEIEIIETQCEPTCGTAIDQYCCGLNGVTIAKFSTKLDVVNEAWRNIALTFFVMLVLAVGTYAFYLDTHHLVIEPIELMVSVVHKLAADPLARFSEPHEKMSKHQHHEYETALIENCLRKIGGLLQVGFGEAGASIIAENMNADGELDPMVRGNKVVAIYGFCDIRNFTDATEVMEEHVMVFVNEIAFIVHEKTSRFSGAPNKNIGDAFLIVWKPSTKPRAKEYYAEAFQDLPDKALASFLKILIEINKPEGPMARYSSVGDPIGNALQNRIPGYRVKIGFGLHVGWSIEGAIGSSRKIDATYLSPHVNLASRLEAATKQYGTHILLSGEMHELLSARAKAGCRQVDACMVKGSAKPIKVFTYDCEVENFKLRMEIMKSHGEVKVVEPNRRISLIGGKEIVTHETSLADYDETIFATDLELVALQYDIPPRFRAVYSRAFNFYISGEWGKAKEGFVEARSLLKSERYGPSLTLLRYMERRNFKAPADWVGYRKLNEK